MGLTNYSLLTHHQAKNSCVLYRESLQPKSIEMFLNGFIFQFKSIFNCEYLHSVKFTNISINNFQLVIFISLQISASMLQLNAHSLGYFLICVEKIIFFFWIVTPFNFHSLVTFESSLVLGLWFNTTLLLTFHPHCHTQMKYQISMYGNILFSVDSSDVPKLISITWFSCH